jgi:hypothetical protein
MQWSRSRHGTIVVLVVCILLSNTFAGGPRKIKLPAPGKTLRVESKLSGIDHTKSFVFHGSAGIKLKIELSGAGPLRGEVISPTGKREGAPGGVIFDEALKETGKYRLEVTESKMGEAWEGSFQITMSVGP